MSMEIFGKSNAGKWLALAVAGCLWLGPGSTVMAQSAPADLSPDLQEVLTLSHQHMDDSVITNYIISTGKTYKLSADDIIYLNGQGVSQAVISALLKTSTGNNSGSAENAAAAPAATPAAAPAASTTSAPAASASPPPLDDSSSQGSEPAPAEPAASSEPAPSAPPAPMMAAGLQDNFYTDGGLNPSLWQTQSGLLTSLASMYGQQVSPVLAFSPSGLQMSGIGGRGQFMGIQSATSFVPPFSFNVTVAGMAQDAIPFEVYLVSSDLRQWLSVTGHLGGHGRPHSSVTFWGPLGGLRIPTGGGNSPEYGIWVNHTGSSWPISALGGKLFEHPLAGIAYTIQIAVDGGGLASVTLLDANRGVLGAESVPVGMGPFYVVLAGRDGPTYAEWQSVQLTPAGPPAPEATEAPAVPPTPTLDYFQSQLAPYGNWINLPGYGLCWQPAVSPGWRPYYDGGHWEYTDAGWFWQSDYPWGDIVFHYGRWAYTTSGWVWVPGYEYAPAWVVWRHDDTDGYIGWAPLPPGAVFVNGGWLYDGQPVGADFDFGLGINFFTFVGYDHFWAHDYRHFVVPHDRLVFVFGHSGIENHYRYDHGVFVNIGLGHDRMVTFTHHDFHPMGMGAMRHDEAMHNAMQRNRDMHNYHSGGQPNGRGQSQNNGGGHSSGGSNGGHSSNGWGH